MGEQEDRSLLKSMAASSKTVPPRSGWAGAGAVKEGVVADVDAETLRARVVAFLWVRVALVLSLTGVVLLTGWFAGHGAADPGRSAVLPLLLASLGFGLLSANAVRLGISIELVAMTQVAWDLGFASAWIYCTGGTGSLFLFLYLFVIIEASFLLHFHGTVLTAFLCAFLYWTELHLEYHRVLQPTRASIAAPVAQAPGPYPAANLIFFLFAVFSTVWLSTHLKQRFGKVRVLLQERTRNLQDLQSLNECIVRCVRSGIITVDPEERVTSMNEAAELITGYTRTELVGRNLSAVLGDLPLREMVSREQDPVRAHRWEQTLRRPDGSTLRLGCSGAVLRDCRGEALGNMIIFQDLTDFKQLEEELQRAERLAAVGELAAGLAHEIRNPLASLYGSIQLLQGELRLERDQKRLMNIILQESERLNGLISDFLQFASTGVGEKEWVGLLEVVEETLEIFRLDPHFPEGIRFEIGIKPAAQVCVNRQQIRQVLWNLLLNAAQAMPRGGTLAVSARGRTRGDGKTWMSLEVRDTGHGIPQENLARVFDPFFTGRANGTGLGLAVVHRIVENHQGKIRVSSEVGKGTAFRIDLPLQVHSSSERREDDRQAGGPS